MFLRSLKNKSTFIFPRVGLDLLTKFRIRCSALFLCSLQNKSTPECDLGGNLSFVSLLLYSLLPISPIVISPQLDVICFNFDKRSHEGHVKVLLHLTIFSVTLFRKFFRVLCKKAEINIPRAFSFH